MDLLKKYALKQLKIDKKKGLLKDFWVHDGIIQIEVYDYLDEEVSIIEPLSSDLKRSLAYKYAEKLQIKIAKLTVLVNKIESL